jgi:hypothetical protein
MRTQPDGVHNLADCTGLHKLSGFNDAAHSEVLGVVDRINTPRFCLRAAHFFELSERGHARLVRHEILTGAHNFDAQGCSVSIYSGARHQSDSRVIKDASAIIETERLRIARRESGGEIVFRRKKAGEARARAKQRIHLTKDVIMVDADDGEADCHFDRPLSNQRDRSKAEKFGVTIAPARSQLRTRLTSRLERNASNWHRRRARY